VSHSAVREGFDSGHEPESLIDRLRSLAALGQESDLVTLANGPSWQLDRLWAVTFKVETEGSTLLQGLDFALEIRGKLRALLLYLQQQVTQGRHGANLPASGAPCLKRGHTDWPLGRRCARDMSDAGPTVVATGGTESLLNHEVDL